MSVQKVTQSGAAGWIVGNLDCELSWAQSETASAGRVRGKGDQMAAPGHPEALSPRALRRIAALATLLRAFALGPRDTVWTPAPVAHARIIDVPGLPRPRFVSGKLGRATAGGGPLLAWGETENVAAWRAREADSASSAIQPDQENGGLREAPAPAGRAPRTTPETGGNLDVWDWPIPSAEAAARVNHRSFGLAVSQALGCALAGSRMIRSIDELTAHLEAGGADASPDAAWVLKAPWSAAGRERVFGQAGAIAGESVARRIEELLERQGSLLFEPWMRRVADFGACGVIGPNGVRRIGMHRLVVDRHGGFRGIDVVRAPMSWEGRLIGLGEEEQPVLEDSLTEVGRALGEAGYKGPFGVDAWRHRDRDGQPAFQALGEINARMTFGLVARALAERVGPAAGWPEDAVIRMRLGKGEPGAGGHHRKGGHRGRRPGNPTTPELLPLLRPGSEDSTCAWLELARDPVDGQ